MTKAWSNWSGSLRFRPGRLVEPESEEELAALVRRAAAAGATVRVVGAGHSSSPLVETDGVLVSLARLNALESADTTACEATIGAGMTLDAANRQLLAHGMGFANLGDVDYQTVAGAVATGTHGTGRELTNLAVYLAGGRLITGSGDVAPFAIKDDPDFLRAQRVSLGCVGILTAMRLRLVPAYRVRRTEWCTQIEACLEAFPQLAVMHRHVDFYWYPRSDEAKIRITDLEEAPRPTLTFARLLEEKVGWSGEIIPQARGLRFEEMEYGLPEAAGLDCFREVRGRVKQRWRQSVGWRVLVRTIAADDAWLSIAHQQATMTISLHQNASLPYREYFADIEPIFRAHGGRPHWGKKHSLLAGELRPLYPDWDRFLAARQLVDPGGTFLNPYLRQVLGVACPPGEGENDKGVA